MPNFTFTSPDGKTYDVQGPDGATKEQAFSILQQRLGSGSGSAPSKAAGAVAPLDRLPPDVSPGNVKPQHADTIADRMLGMVKGQIGAGEAALSAVTAIPAGIAGQVYGIGKTLTGGKFGTPQGAQQGEAAGVGLANKLTYQPRTEAGKGILEGMGNAMDASRLAGLPVESPMMARIPEVPRGVLATGEGATGAARGAAGKVAAKALPEIDPETRELAQQAHAMGFRLTPDQVLGGKYAKAVGEAAAQIPLSGSNLKENQATFTRNLAKQAGLDSEAVTRKAFDGGLKKWGSQIGDINAKYDIPVDRNLVQALKSNGHGQLPDVSKVVNYYTDMIQKEAKTGALPGATFRKINTDLNRRISTTSNGDLKYALGNLQEDLLDAQQARMTPQDQAALMQARKHYAVLKTIEPLVAKSTDGQISPASLLGALTSTKAGKSRVARGAAGDLGTLADIGQKFLKGQPDSGTAPRLWAQHLPTALAGLGGAAAGAAGGALPAAAALGGTLGAANLYNRLGPSVTDLLIRRPPQP